MFFDLPLDQLRTRRSESPEPADFDAFWSRTLAESRALTSPPTITAYDSGLASVDVFDVRFAGFNGEPIAAWLTVPKGAPPRTTVVQYHGYSGSRGLQKT